MKQNFGTYDFCVLHAKQEIIRNLQHDQLNCRFGMKLWPFAHKKLSQKIDDSHIFNKKCVWNKLSRMDLVKFMEYRI